MNLRVTRSIAPGRDDLSEWPPILADVSDYTIRSAEPADYEAAGRLTLDAYNHDDMVHTESGYDKELLDAARRAEMADLLVAVDHAGTIVGTVTFCRAGTEYAEISAPGEAEFRMLGVAPQARGRGIGEALVLACVDLARSHHDAALVLSTMTTMNTAHGIYRRLGFERAPERDWTPVPAVDLIVYRLDLS